jgi:hypothetical protein
MDDPWQARLNRAGGPGLAGRRVPARRLAAAVDSAAALFTAAAGY